MSSSQEWWTPKRGLTRMEMSRNFSSYNLLKETLCGIAGVIFFIYCWIPLPLHAGSSLSNQEFSDDLFSVTFPTEQDGWACGRWGTVLHTTDGGHTWARQESGTEFTLTSVYFVDTNNGWAVGDMGTIIHTSDGGKTWEKQKSPKPYILMGIEFVNDRKGWIVAEWTTILYTEDGGATWKVQFGDEDYILKSLSFCDENNGWAVGEYGYIYHTTNGGKTWEQQAGEFGVSEQTGDIVAGNYLFDVVAINPQTAWVVGIDSYIARTRDGGANWQEVGGEFPRTQLFATAVGEKGVMAIGGTATLLMSSDGGKTFSVPKVEPHIRYSWIYEIAPRGSAGFVAVGKGGCIYMSDGKATSWKLAGHR